MPPKLHYSMHSTRLRWVISHIARACCLLFLAGCATTTTLPDQHSLSPLSAEAAAFVAPGSFDYTLLTGEHRGEHGCGVDYETYRPSGAADDTMVFLAHGFLRSLKTMRGWAEHWASHGVAVTVMSLCNSSAFAGRHDRNAEDLVSLANKLHAGPVIYAGFSAGGLAAHVAAANDPRTVGYLGLDSVDHKGLAIASIPETGYPVLLLIAEPSACNAKNNILDAAAHLPASEALRITYSTHCHFEYPYDSQCEIACGSVRPRESQLILIDTVRSLATAWILEARRGARDSVLTSGAWAGRVEILREDLD